MASPASLLVVCLCAEWCGVCRDYRAAFEQVRALFPGARFLWVDVEDEADWVDPLEVDNFPTLLVAVADTPRFLGTVVPIAARLERLVRDRSADDAPPLNDPDALALLGRLRTAHG
jgi:thioredoxin 1